MAQMPALQRWVVEHHQPMVMCAPTPAAERICQKNGLSFSELVRPFGLIHSAGGVPIRTTTRSYTLKHFRVRFVDAAALRPPTLAEVDARLMAVAREHLPDGSVRDQFQARHRRRRGPDKDEEWYSAYVAKKGGAGAARRAGGGG